MVIMKKKFVSGSALLSDTSFLFVSAIAVGEAPECRPNGTKARDFAVAAAYSF